MKTDSQDDLWVFDRMGRGRLGRGLETRLDWDQVGEGLSMCGRLPGRSRDPSPLDGSGKVVTTVDR